MNVKNRIKLITIALFLFFCQTCGLAAPLHSKITGTFSSFEYHRESGDLVGIEIRLIRVKTGLKALVQFADGGAGELLLVDIVHSGDKIAFTSPSNYEPAMKFDGIVTRGGLTGTFVYSSGAVEKVFLKRAQSYWDR